jgi:hypothetical protein
VLKYLFTILVLAFFPANLLSADTPDIIGVIHTDTSETLFGYRIIPLGDQNGDGYDDFITWDYRHKAFVYYGGDTTDSTPDLIIYNVQSRMNNIGDINNDGYDDVAMGDRMNNYRKLSLFFGGPLMDGTRNARFGWDSLYPIGFSDCCMDFDGDGILELIAWTNTQISVLTFNMNALNDSIPHYIITPGIEPYDGYIFGEGLIVGDFNNDGDNDLAVNLRRQMSQALNGSIYLYWGGDLKQTPDLIITRPGDFEYGYDEFGRVLENLGDINGDGVDDIYSGTGNGLDTAGFIYFGGTDIDDIPDVIIAKKSTVARAAGDINKDGINDLINSYPLPFVSMGYVFVYYGGPDMDSIPDIAIYNSQIEGSQEYFGEDISGIGDFNNDGVDDFAFSAIEYSLEYWSRGVVYVMSGIGGSSDVEIEHNPQIPDKFELYQNYPNPFNLNTTISFDIPYRSHATLTIHNILGQELARLIDKELTVGLYSIKWDGRDNSNAPVASGVYLYRLVAGDAVHSRKMILIK